MQLWKYIIFSLLFQQIKLAYLLAPIPLQPLSLFLLFQNPSCESRIALFWIRLWHFVAEVLMPTKQNIDCCWISSWPSTLNKCRNLLLAVWENKESYMKTSATTKDFHCLSEYSQTFTNFIIVNKHRDGVLYFSVKTPWKKKGKSFVYSDYQTILETVYKTWTQVHGSPLQTWSMHPWVLRSTSPC